MKGLLVTEEQVFKRLLMGQILHSSHDCVKHAPHGKLLLFSAPSGRDPRFADGKQAHLHRAFVTSLSPQSLDPRLLKYEAGAMISGG